MFLRSVWTRATSRSILTKAAASPKIVIQTMKRFFQFRLLFSLAVSPLFVFAQAAGEPAGGQATTNNGGSQSSLVKCLPTDIKLNDVVEATSSGYANGQPVGSQKITVEQKLNELKATCSGDNNLVDGNGRQISFYHLIGCWGNPPRNYQDILKRQREEIDKLKRQYTVIEITCNPSGVPIP